ncbi:hypothetical protein ACFOY4_41375 [Actinomadura syzygii]|uniref:hypothetical protein n=1 Tax=Actinomadura syzygii TaxID=1427538 RepID=UPI0016524237|nr:hypothetical protein [Actinomadura syzygii]
MAASGMLAVGAAGLASAMCWLMMAHVDGGSEHDGGEAHRRALAHLGRVTRLATLGVVVGVALQLARTTSEYLSVVYGRPALWVLCSTLVVPGLVITAVLLLPTLRRGFTRRSRARRDAARHSLDLHQASVPFATFGSVAYGTLTPVFAGVMTSLPPSWWESGSAPLVAATALVNSVVPGVLLVAHVLAAPLGGGQWLRPEQPPT